MAPSASVDDDEPRGENPVKNEAVKNEAVKNEEGVLRSCAGA